jgi:CRP-like cAMP-binding protein
MNANVLRRFPLFGGLEERELDAVAKLCAHKEYSAGVYVTEEGRLASTLFLLEQGEVQVTVVPGEGSLSKEFYVVPGGLFGCSSLLPPYIYDNTTRTVTPVQLLAIDAVGLRELFEQEPRLGVTLQRNMIQLLLRSMAEHRLEAWT